MSSHHYSAEDFRDALLRLLPSGLLWNRSKENGLGKLFHVLGQVYQDGTHRALSLLGDLFPGTTYHFIDEWEKTLDLPDSCMGDDGTPEQRRNAIIAKLTDEGGSSVRYYITLAQNLGVPITIEEFAPARAGVMRAGQRCYGRNWAFAWRVTIPRLVVSRFRSGRNTAGNRLRTWQRGYIECVIRKHSPAHTALFFRYFTTEER